MLRPDQTRGFEFCEQQRKSMSCHIMTNKSSYSEKRYKLNAVVLNSISGSQQIKQSFRFS